MSYPTVSESASGFDCIYGQAEAVLALKSMLQSRNIPNALLFTGNRDTGRKKAAICFAQTLNCENKKESLSSNEPCNKCRSCRKIISGMHPDIIQLSPEKDKIKISQIRDIYPALTMAPHEAEMRMVVIENAGKMNTQAGNALLKMLEEPPERTFFILLAENLADLLPTIISRCRHIRFRHISCESIKLKLINEYDIDPMSASIAAASSSGSITKALMLVNIRQYPDPGKPADKHGNTVDWIKRRKWLVQEFSNLIIRAKKIRTDTSAALIMAEKLSREPELLKDSIFIIKTWLRDLAVYRYNPEKIINSDFFPLLKNITAWVSVQKVISWFRELYAAESRIESNTSIRLTLECFFLKLILMAS